LDFSGRTDAATGLVPGNKNNMKFEISDWRQSLLEYGKPLRFITPCVAKLGAEKIIHFVIPRFARNDETFGDFFGGP
jgi:hypothetical protein